MLPSRVTRHGLATLMLRRLNLLLFLQRNRGVSGADAVKRCGPWMIVTCFFLACAAASAQSPEGPATIRFDLSRLNDSGLHGPPGGLRALSYEYCVPSGEKYVNEVKSIDPGATVYSRSRGRIGCAGDQALVTGNTHQPRFREILENLAALPYVTRIDESFFE